MKKKSKSAVVKLEKKAKLATNVIEKLKKKKAVVSEVASRHR